MKLNLLVIIFILIGILPTHGQNIRGKVLDTDNNPIVGATVLSLSADSSFISGTTTNEEGVFNLTTSKSEGIVSISYLGFQKHYISVDKDNLGVIVMKRDVNSLKEVVIKSNRIINNAKGYSIKPDGSGLEKCNNMQEMIAFLPGMSISQNKIMLLGNLPVVYVNEIKITSQDELAALLPNQIDKIEVDYIAIGEGANEKGGIVRITTKKQKDGGYSGYIKTQGMIMTNYGYTQGSPTFVFDASRGKWTINYYAIYSNQKLLEDATNNFQYADGQYSNTSYETRSWMNNISTRLNISYDLSKKAKIAVSEYVGNVDIKNKQNTIIFPFLENGNIRSVKSSLQKPESKFSQQTVAKYVLTTDERGSNLDITADYLLQNYHNNQIEELNGSRTFEDKTRERTDMFRFIPKYKQKFANGNVLETAGGYQYIHYNDVSGELGNSANIHIPSACVNYSGRYKFIMYSAGLTLQYNRMEVETRGQKTLFSDTHLCPEATLVWMMNPKRNTMLRFMYRNTVSEMPYSVINSYKVYSSPNSYTTGNPSLVTPRDHSVMAGFSLNQHIQAMFVYDYVIDPIFYDHGIDEQDSRVTWARPENANHEQMVGAMLEANYSPTKWWQTKVQSSAMQIRFSSDKETKNGQWCGKFWWNNIFNFTPTFGGTFNGYWETGCSFENYHWKPVGNFDASLWKTFYKDRLRFSLQSTIWAKGRQSRTEGNGYSSFYHNRTKATSFLFTVTWNFSGGKDVRQRIEAESIQQYNKIEEKK